MIITLNTDKLQADCADALPEIAVAGIIGVFDWLTHLSNDAITENVKSGAITLSGDIR
jgi:hypothetical protein